ncbi:hypothetical protein FRC03_009630 [Tulasnella sp. 419]|nr:hypothetical protein FRC03_009630 [Tulasnella sp. 419]
MLTNNKDTSNPPSYDIAVSDVATSSVGSPRQGPYQLYAQSDVKVPPQPEAQPPVLYPAMVPTTPPSPAVPGTRVYHYQNPQTLETVASLLPPDHPTMVCLQRGGHETKTKYGIVGILTAILWFPLGVGVCLLDRKTTCRRCGAVLREGLST